MSEPICKIFPQGVALLHPWFNVTYKINSENLTVRTINGDWCYHALFLKLLYRMVCYDDDIPDLVSYDQNYFYVLGDLSFAVWFCILSCQLFYQGFLLREVLRCCWRYKLFYSIIATGHLFFDLIDLNKLMSNDQ